MPVTPVTRTLASGVVRIDCGVGALSGNRENGCHSVESLQSGNVGHVRLSRNVGQGAASQPPGPAAIRPRAPSVLGPAGLRSPATPLPLRVVCIARARPTESGSRRQVSLSWDHPCNDPRAAHSGEGPGGLSGRSDCYIGLPSAYEAVSTTAPHRRA
jgi:hypothetical protein